jgi:V8-like Glu-specific endopeptidase
VRAIPDDNLAYPVLITLKNGSQGSGFFLNASKATFLVTARHVLFKQKTDDLLDSDAEILSYARDPKDTGKNEFVLDLKALKQNGEIRRHADHDVAVIRIGIRDESAQRTLNATKGVSMRQMAKTGILGVAESTIKCFSDVLTANQVFIFGYPTSLGLKTIAQIDHLRPLLRGGIVAGTNNQTKTLIIDCPAYGGNSGGPVLEIEQEDRGRRMWIIGVVSQFVPAVENWVNVPHGYANTNVYNSGYTVSTPMDFVMELVAQF